MMKKKILRFLLCISMLLSICPQIVSAENTVNCGTFQITGGVLSTDYRYEDHVLTVLTNTKITITGGGSDGDRIEIQSKEANVTVNQLTINNTDSHSALAVNSGSTLNLTLVGNNSFGSSWDSIHTTNIVVGDKAALNINGEGSLYCGESLNKNKMSIGAEAVVNLNEGTLNLRTTDADVITGNGVMNVNGGLLRLRIDTRGQFQFSGFNKNVDVNITGGTTEFYERDTRFGGNKLTVTGGKIISSSSLNLNPSEFVLDGGLLDINGSISEDLKNDPDRSWNGLVFEGKNGNVYGSYTLNEDYTLEKGDTLTVHSDATLDIGEGITFIDNGRMENMGTIHNNGSIKISSSAEYTGNEPENNPLLYETNYLDELGAKQTAWAAKVKSSQTVWESGWYAVDEDVTINDRLNVSGDVHLILKDNADLTVNGGINVPQGNSFTIYAQSKEEKTMGSLTADAASVSNSAGIGSTYSYSTVHKTGSITINGGIVHATGADFSSGIGDGDNCSDAIITINGGIVYANSGLGSVGIGGSNDTITINGGQIYAKARSNTSMWNAGAGIGGGWNSSGGNITINGGYVEATGATASDGNGGAGIGAGNYDGDHLNIKIVGGIVHAVGGNGADDIGASTDSARFIHFSTEDGNAIIYADKIIDGDQNDYSCILFSSDGKNGVVYGDIQLTEELEINAGDVLTIPSGSTLENSNKIVNNGTIKVNNGGNYTGTQPSGNNVTYQIDWDTDGDGSIDDTTYVSYGSVPTHSDGSKASDAQYTYHFAGWSPALDKVDKTTQYTAMFDHVLNQFNVTLQKGEGYTIDYSGNTTLDYGSDFMFTVEVADGYSKTDDFEVKANDKVLAPNSDGSYTVNVTADTQISVEGVKDTTAPNNLVIRYDKDHFTEYDEKSPFHLFFNKAITVTISADDLGSGVKSISYQLGDDETKVVNAENGQISFDIDSQFIGNIHNVKAIDHAGNESSILNSEYFAVETDGPSQLKIDTNGYESGQWTNDDVTFTVTGAQATSGIAKYQYSTDGGKNWKDMVVSNETKASSTQPANVTEAQLQVSNEGTTNYLFRSVSNAGNESVASAPVVVKIDKTTPEGNITVGENHFSTFLNKITFGLFFNENIELTISAKDDRSGLSEIAYLRSEQPLTKEELLADRTEWKSYTGTIMMNAVDAEKFIYYGKITDSAGNVTLISTDGMVFDTTAPTFTGITPDAAYYTTQKVTVNDTNLDSVTVNGKEVQSTTFTLAGNTDTTYTIVAKDKAGNSASITVQMKSISNLAPSDTITTTDKQQLEDKKDLITGLLEDENLSEQEKEQLQTILDKVNTDLDQIESAQAAGNTENIDKIINLDPDKVQTSDKADLEAAKNDLEAALDAYEDVFTQEEKEQLQTILDKVNTALDRIESAQAAGSTESIDKVINLDPDKVQTSDKTDLEAAKNDLEASLDMYEDVFTKEEKEQLQTILDKVNAALESIEKITSMQEAIDKLPAGVEPDDLAAIEQIETIAEQYDQLSDNEKQQLGTSIDKLNQLLADSKNYQILAGMNSVWYIGSNQDLTITANGAPERLESLLLEGKTLAKEAYTVQKGSTIVTLKAGYLEKLAAGEHTLTFVYANGETKASFTIVAPAQQGNENLTENSQTGAANTILPWAAFTVVCAGAVIALIVYRKKNSH